MRGLRVAGPDLGFKPLLAKLREQQLDLGAATKEVREALNALKAEGEAAKAAAAASPAVNKSFAPLNVALSLTCIGCLRLPLDMDDGRENPIYASYPIYASHWSGVSLKIQPLLFSFTFCS